MSTTVGDQRANMHRGKIAIHFDGACHNKVNQYTPMGLGIAVFIDGQYSEEHSVGMYGGCGTSNVAEWKACVMAMSKLADLKTREEYKNYVFSVYSDSQLVANQFNGRFAINKPHFRKHYDTAKAYATGVDFYKPINWISREKNKHADKLSKQGLDLTPEHLKKKK